MSESNLLKYVRGGVSSKIIFVIFTYGSEKGKWLTQKDVKAILWPKGSGRASNIFKELTTTKLFFNYGSEEQFVSKYTFNQQLKTEVPYIIKDNKLSINWNTTKGNQWVYIPKYDWLDKLFGFELTENQKNFIKNIFLDTETMRIKYNIDFTKLSDNFEIDLLDIIKTEILDHLTIFTIGYSLFGENYYKYIKSYQEKQTTKMQTLPIFDMEKKIGIKITNYNYMLLNMVLGYRCDLSIEELSKLAGHFIVFNKSKGNFQKMDLNAVCLISLACASKELQSLYDYCKTSHNLMVFRSGKNERKKEKN